jgi:hypothetical protein
LIKVPATHGDDLLSQLPKLGLRLERAGNLLKPRPSPIHKCLPMPID